jgi:arylformamidase
MEVAHMEIFDISLTIRSGMVVWPGDPQVNLERVSKIEEGAHANVSRLQMSVHTGTHLDAPYHFVHGAKTIETLPLDVLLGPVQVVHLADEVDLITADVIRTAGIAPGTTRLLFKTRNSAYWLKSVQTFEKDFVAVSADGAHILVSMGIRLVGIDYLSIAPFNDGVPTHQVLLKNEVVVLEGINLNGISAGNYSLICLPPKLGGADGSPARALLIKD